MGWFSKREPYARTARITADELAEARFDETKVREGYYQPEVDSFLDRCVETLRGIEGGEVPSHPLTVREVVGMRFSQTKFRTGYDQDQVDDLLDRVAATLHDAEG
jgi:DivIVA domain-containing protein